MAEQKKVLVLGAGMSTAPLIVYLSGKGFRVTVASRTLSKAEQLCKGLENASAVQLDVEAPGGADAMDGLVAQHDAAISMLPYTCHPLVAESAIRHRKHFLTTSYISDAMKGFEEKAKELGLVFINECGLDPGTDHMSAMKLMDRVRAEGGIIRAFHSYCGGLPAPKDENNTANPFGYKFSWSPRGVLLAGRNTARFLLDGEVQEVAGTSLFSSYKMDNFDLPPFTEKDALECYPNRDSTIYKEVFGLHDAHTLIRGTYRLPGWCDTILAMTRLGLIDTDARTFSGNTTYAEFVLRLVKEKGGDGTTGEVRDAVRKVLKNDSGSNLEEILDRMEWLGLFSETQCVPGSTGSYLDAVCGLMMSKPEMQLAPGEQDMVVMKHTFLVEYPGDRKDTLTSSMVRLGHRFGQTAMAETVSYPVGIATRLVLDGHFTTPGLHRPICPELYNPILAELEELNVMVFIEKTVSSEKL